MLWLDVVTPAPPLRENHIAQNFYKCEGDDMVGVRLRLVETRDREITFPIIGNDVRVVTDHFPIEAPVSEAIANEPEGPFAEEVSCRRDHRLIRTVPILEGRIISTEKPPDRSITDEECREPTTKEPTPGNDWFYVIWDGLPPSPWRH